MEFNKIFERFSESCRKLKVISVASADKNGKPNSAPKMLIDVVEPNLIYFIDYKFTVTHANLTHNPLLSISIMDDMKFAGFRLSGNAICLKDGPEYDEAKKKWEKKLISYEADRIIQRVTGGYSAREAENALPKDFFIVKFIALEASEVKPERAIRAAFHLKTE